MNTAYKQLNQPAGVPPLELTGERTLPDVPEENYWFRRHLVVYEWIAKRVGGREVVDMACGEGYGADVLASTARSVVGVEANPETYEHARLRYLRSNLTFKRDLVEKYNSSCDVVVCLQTIEHLQKPDQVLVHFRDLLKPGGVLYLSTPNVRTLAPKGSQRSDNPWHLREYDVQEFRQLCESVFNNVELIGLFHAKKLRWHEGALKLGWDKFHRRLGVTKSFYSRFVPAICEGDFKLKHKNLDKALDFLAVCQK